MLSCLSPHYLRLTLPATRLSQHLQITSVLSMTLPGMKQHMSSLCEYPFWHMTPRSLTHRRCVFIPLVGKIYTIFNSKYTYFVFMAVFQVGSIVCAVANSSHVFIIGRAVNGIGSAGLLSGALLIIFAACGPTIRPVVTSFAMSLISVGAITGPLIAGALTGHVTWRWCMSLAQLSLGTTD